MAEITNDDLMGKLIVAAGEAWCGVEDNITPYEMDDLTQNIFCVHCKAAVEAILTKLAEIGVTEEMRDAYASEEFEGDDEEAFRAALRNLAGE